MPEQRRTPADTRNIPPAKQWTVGKGLTIAAAILAGSVLAKTLFQPAMNSAAPTVEPAEVAAAMAAREAMLVEVGGMLQETDAERDGAAITPDYLSSAELIELFSADHWFCSKYDAQTATCANISTARMVNDLIVETRVVSLAADGTHKAVVSWSIPLVGNAQCAVMADYFDAEMTFYEASDRSPNIGPAQPVIGRFKLSELPEQEIRNTAAELTGGHMKTFDPGARVCERYARHADQSVMTVMDVDGVTVASTQDDISYLARPNEVSLRP